MTTHTSVLKEEVIEALDIQPNDVVVDATVGGAGHFNAIMEKLGEKGVLIGIDADPTAIKRARELAGSATARVILAHDNYKNLEHILEKNSITEIHKILFDLGWSSDQLQGGYGLSFQNDEPLDMGYAHTGEHITAGDLVNESSEQSLADLIHTLGEERFAKSIARAIVLHRERGPIQTTKQLADIVFDATPLWYQRARIHPATKTFQALRIAVNDELTSIQTALKVALKYIAPGGVIAVITFHSIEDRLVKHLFRDAVHSGCGELREKKPIVPARQEILENKRARSAKLRTFVRTQRAHLESSDHVCQTVAYA